MNEIQEREAFLRDMAELGRGKEFEGKIRIEIKEVSLGPPSSVDALCGAPLDPDVRAVKRVAGRVCAGPAFLCRSGRTKLYV